MKKSGKIVVLLIITIIVGGSLAVFFSVDKFKQIGKITTDILYRRSMNWYENQAQKEIESANDFAKERLEKKYHVFVNGILVDNGYDWDGTVFVPIRTIAGSLNWTVNWIPELGVIQLVKDKEEAYVDIVNFFGKAYVDLDSLENLLRLQEVCVHGGNIEIEHYKDNNINSLNFNKMERYNFFIDGMKMTDRAVAYKGKNYIPAQIFSMSFGKTFHYDAVKGQSYIAKQKLNSIYVDGEAYSTLNELKNLINTDGCTFNYERFSTDNNRLLPIIYKGPKKKVVALTFDDYLGDKVPALLAALKKSDVKATFYIIGNSVETNGDIVKAIVEQGHEIANHTWDHFNVHTLRDDEIRAQLISTQLVLQRYSGGSKPITFRPPGGYYDNKIVRIAQEVGLNTVLWSINSTDADLNNGPSVIKDVIVKSTQPGSIIVMHMGRESTIEALPDAIEVLRRKGYNFVTVSRMLDSEERDRN